MTETPRYLLALYIAERHRQPPVSPGRIADRLDRSPSAATEMLQRLDERGLVAYEPYDGVTLTDEGRAEAAELYDRYRTLVRFFRDVLGVEDAQAEAMRLAGVVSTTVADRLGSTVLADSGTGTADAPGVGSREQS